MDSYSSDQMGVVYVPACRLDDKNGTLRLDRAGGMWDVTQHMQGTPQINIHVGGGALGLCLCAHLCACVCFICLNLLQKLSESLSKNLLESVLLSPLVLLVAVTPPRSVAPEGSVFLRGSGGSSPSSAPGDASTSY